MKMWGKGEMWSLHYHHGNLLRDQVTLHVPVFFLLLFKDSAGRLKKTFTGRRLKKWYCTGSDSPKQ